MRTWPIYQCDSLSVFAYLSSLRHQQKAWYFWPIANSQFQTENNNTKTQCVCVWQRPVWGIFCMQCLHYKVFVVHCSFYLITCTEPGLQYWLCSNLIISDAQWHTHTHPCLWKSKQGLYLNTHCRHNIITQQHISIRNEWLYCVHEVMKTLKNMVLLCKTTSATVTTETYSCAMLSFSLLQNWALQELLCYSLLQISEHKT